MCNGTGRADAASVRKKVEARFELGRGDLFVAMLHIMDLSIDFLFLLPKVRLP